MIVAIQHYTIAYERLMEGKKFSLLQKLAAGRATTVNILFKCRRAPKSCPGNNINGVNVYIGRVGCDCSTPLCWWQPHTPSPSWCWINQAHPHSLWRIHWGMWAQHQYCKAQCCVSRPVPHYMNNFNLWERQCQKMPKTLTSTQAKHSTQLWTTKVHPRQLSTASCKHTPHWCAIQSQTH